MSVRPLTSRTLQATTSGAVDEQAFEEIFKQVEPLNVFSKSDLNDQITKIHAGMCVDPEEWQKRVNACKLLRNLVSSGADQFDDFFTQLKRLESPIDSLIGDLRSQVVREAAVTVAYMSIVLKNRFAPLSETFIPKLIQLIPSSAKVMASSGIVAMKYILKNTFSFRLITHFIDSAKSKSNVTRRYTFQFFEIILQNWPLNFMDKHSSAIKDAIKNGISDADQEARSISRRCFVLFRNHFPALADSLLSSLDSTQRKLVEKELSDSGSTLSGSTSRVGSQSNLSGVAKRPDRPAMGTSGLNSVRKISAAPTSRPGANPATSHRMVTQSQPASRETSPTRSIGGFSVSCKPTTVSNGILARRQSNIGRSTGSYSTQASRDGSPARSVNQAPIYARKSSYGSASGYSYRNKPSITSMSDAGAFCDASNYRGGKLDSDEASETSSMCSDRSGRSVPTFRKQAQIRYTDNIQEIIKLLISEQWSDRNCGLINLQRFMRDGKTLTGTEIQRITKAFTGHFQDKHSKNVHPFMETLQLFVRGYNELIHDWLYTLIVRLMMRQGCETLASQQMAIQATLTEVRNNFPLPLQFSTCCRFIIDKLHTPTLKVKAYLLEYMKDVVSLMNPQDLLGLKPQDEEAIGKVITWSQEPKSDAVRRMSGRVIMKLHDLNSQQFLIIINKMPTSIQDQARKLLKTYEKTSHGGTNTVGLHSDNFGDPPNSRRLSVSSTSSSRLSTTSPAIMNLHAQQLRKQSCPQVPLSFNNNRMSLSNTNTQRGSFGFTGAIVPSPKYATQSNPPFAGHDDTLVAVEEITKNLQMTFLNSTAPMNGTNSSINSREHQQLQNPPLELHMYKPKKPVIGYQTLRKIREIPPDNVVQQVLEELSNHNESSRMIDALFNDATNKSLMELENDLDDDFESMEAAIEAEMALDGDERPMDSLYILCCELNNCDSIQLSPEQMDDLYEQRKVCMFLLIKLIRENSINTWNEHFKPILLILLETLGDDGAETRALALRVLQDLIAYQPERFLEFLHLTIMKVLEAALDRDVVVAKAAEHCAQEIADHLPPERCLLALIPMISEINQPKALPAIVMETRVISNASPEHIRSIMHQLRPGLITACEHESSLVRKAAIFCLVEISFRLNEDILPYLPDLPIPKRKLLNFYIERRKTQGSVNSIESTKLQR